VEESRKDFASSEVPGDAKDHDDVVFWTGPLTDGLVFAHVLTFSSNQLVISAAFMV
jgi:hypothetical protein